MEQVCAYLAISPDTFRRICSVAPVELGVRLLRWRRLDIDAWAEGLPPKMGAPREQDMADTIIPSDLASEERRSAAVTRAHLRTGRQRNTTCH